MFGKTGQMERCLLLFWSWVGCLACWLLRFEKQEISLMHHEIVGCLELRCRRMFLRKESLIVLKLFVLFFVQDHRENKQETALWRCAFLGE